MARMTRSTITGGAILASVAAIAVPVANPGAGFAGAPTPTALSAAQYQLTALSDITVAGITDAVSNGWGGNLGPSDPFYPGVYANDTKISGIPGAVYYVLDQSGLVPFNLDDYYFEAGGVNAVAYVGISSVFGADSLPGQLAKAVFADGTLDIADAVVALTAGIPVIGAVTSVYFTGQVPGDSTVYGTGFAGVLAYAETVLPGISGLLENLGIGDRDWSDDDDHDDDHDDDDDDDEDEDDDRGRGYGKGNGKGHGAAAVATQLVSAPVAAVAAVPDIAVDLGPTEAANSGVEDDAPVDSAAPATVDAVRTPADAPREAVTRRPANRAAGSASAPTTTPASPRARAARSGATAEPASADANNGRADQGE